MIASPQIDTRERSFPQLQRVSIAPPPSRREALELFDPVEHERKKRALRSRLKTEAERASRRYTVLPSPWRGSRAPGAAFIIRNPYDIRPARPIAPKDVEKLNAAYSRLSSLPSEEQFDAAIEVGFWLRAWHDLFPSEGYWNIWRSQHLTLSQDEISRLTYLWDHHEEIKAHERKGVQK